MKRIPQWARQRAARLERSRDAAAERELSQLEDEAMDGELEDRGTHASNDDDERQDRDRSPAR
jgi:hypothetical protein